MSKEKSLTLQEMMAAILKFWNDYGCVIHQGYDLETGAGTFNPATFLRALGPEPYKTAYVEPSRRPQDGRYGMHPNRLQNYHQLQVILKPAPENLQELFLDSLKSIGLDLREHDIRFVHDDWENPTIGAWGLGWEVWLNGMEITQMTYFQSVGSKTLETISGEITYGIERIAMYLQKKNSVYDIMWNDSLTYGDIVHDFEKTWSYYNFDEANTEMWLRHFEDFSEEATRCVAVNLPVSAYDFVIKASHAFNILDARGVISVTERTRYISRIRQLARAVADSYVKWRETLGFPLQKKAAQNSTSCSAFETFPLESPQDFVLEIGSEELPASFVPIGIKNLECAISSLLKENGISHSGVTVFGSPRRLTAYVRNMAAFSVKDQEEKKGPPLASLYDENKAITECGKKFFESQGLSAPLFEDLPSLAQYELRKIKNVDYLFLIHPSSSRPSAEILIETLPLLIKEMKFPKKMVWDESNFEYARPIRWLLALHGSSVIPVRVGKIVASNKTYGHRQLSPASIEITSANEYEALLEKSYVIVSQHVRRTMIESGLDKICAEYNLQVVSKNKLCEETCYLSEYPFIAKASFDKKFCSLPVELLTAEMIQHQKYFPLKTLENEISNIFAIVCDNTPNSIIIEGNEKALVPRLTDGRFLFEQDLKTPLEYFVNKLHSVTFIEGLGSLHDKVERLKKHASVLQKLIPLSGGKDLISCVTYCKADLVSSVVNEFPELQGIMGKYYARNASLPDDVAIAIGEHLCHITQEKTISPLGALLSLTDRVDNILACFLLDLKPSSSQDPYALRRQSLEILLLLKMLKAPVDLREILSNCLEHFPLRGNSPENLIEEVLSFILGRLKTLLSSSLECSKEEVSAVMENAMTTPNPVLLFDRAQNLKNFRALSKEKMTKILTGYKRLKNILASIRSSSEEPFCPELLGTDQEVSLLQFLSQKRLDSLDLQGGTYFSHLETLTEKVNDLLDSVRISDGDAKVICSRRLLLKQAEEQFNEFYALDKIGF
ncbi:glycine--tRNA ligase [Chlamydiifrater phoenicopteri]|uniref:glycine--tRNA ligase n=1 Tax=Chlamydiifrater phoenicopteri TaxID=2681469 RepID=UPI001FE42DC4|nr:glycine--tRNA ligase [Chlamydiifrater phoenicopteri]